MIHYLAGDATQPNGSGNKIICHICNDSGGWGKGFVLAISKRWPAPEQSYRQWYQNRDDSNFVLGQVQFVDVTEHLQVANMIAQHGTRPKNGEPPIRYAALKECLAVVAQHAKQCNASLHMPKIGCGLAGGEWHRVEELISQTLLENGLEVFVYDFK